MTHCDRNIPISTKSVVSTSYDVDAEKLKFNLIDGTQIILTDVKLRGNTFVHTKDVTPCSKWYMPFIATCSAAALVMSFVSLMNSLH